MFSANNASGFDFSRINGRTWKKLLFLAKIAEQIIDTNETVHSDDVSDLKTVIPGRRENKQTCNRRGT